MFRGFWPPGEKTDVANLVENGLVDVGVRVRSYSPAEGRRFARLAVDLVYDPSSVASGTAKRAVEDRLRAVDEAWYRLRLAGAGVVTPPPVEIAAAPVKAAGGGPAVTIAAVLPLVLLLMTVTGAVYPAIDLTAGERERGTLEALVAAPVSRRAVLAAKYVAVFTVAVLTAGMNLIAMAATAFSLGLDRLLFGGGLNATAVSQTVALVLVLAAFFSAVLLLVTSFARSFKEAQAYLIPVMLVSLAPGIVSLMPDLPLTLPLAITPLIGVVLLSRDLFMGGAHGLLIAACVGSTLLYAAVALVLAARAFGTDAVLYGSAGTWSEMFRRPEGRQNVPPATAAAACLAAVFPAFLLLGPIPARLENLSVAGRLTANAGLTILLFFALPSLVASMSRAEFRSTFRLRVPRLVALLGGVLLGLSLWPFAYEVQILTLSEERVDVFKKLYEAVRGQLDAVPLWIKWLTLAVVPAVCEEWFFRGFLLSSLRARSPAWLAVLVTAALFGAFHVVVRDGLLFERFVPTTFLGLILGAVCVRTGSLWPGILVHVLHNGLLLTLSDYQKRLSELGWGGGEREHLPWTWLAIAAGATVVGAAFVWLGRRKTNGENLAVR
jgi:ABC-type Na+ efflux pump permease subunit/membrane protease YdiL (CAAX protease family)